VSSFDDLYRRALRDAVHEESFSPDHSGKMTIGSEIELLVFDEECRPIPLAGERGLIRLLERFGDSRGWMPFVGYDGSHRFTIPGTGTVTFEPGGQLELSSLPHATIDALVDRLHGFVDPLRDWLSERGAFVELVGIDPYNDAPSIPLQLDVDRYRRMTDHFERIGPFGIRMMRQTAAMQISLDRGSNAASRWRLLNDLAPYLIAIFANSPRHSGSETGHQSFRAHCWRRLDPARTGMALESNDPAAQYVDFAMSARDILDAGWDAHLTTLFPEVRPRGHYEVRSCDAVDSQWFAAPLVFLAGLAYDERASAEASTLAADSRALLPIAGQLGLNDAAIARTARDLFQLALDGARRLGEKHVGGASLDIAAEFYSRYTARDQSPASESANRARIRTVRSSSSRV
jgi:glutamate--cysteine ligase